MSLIEHAKRELEIAGLFDKNSDYDGMLGTATMELMEVFSKQGHSGYSANMVINLFTKLANYQTLSPITADDSEWVLVGSNGSVGHGPLVPQADGSACPDCGWLVRRLQDDGSVQMEHAYNCRRNQSNKNLYQHKRNPSVFKEGKDGKAYHIDAYIQRNSNGILWHSCLNFANGTRLGKCYIKNFANMPTIIINVEEQEDEKDDWKIWIADVSQLDELAKYYDFEILQ